MIERITQAELARRLGISRQSIYKHIKCGKLTKDEDGLLDFSQAKAELSANLKKIDGEILNILAGNPTGQPTGTGTETEAQKEPPGIFAARLRIMEADAAQREIKLAVTRGELHDRSSCEHATFSVARLLRDTLIDTLPGKISHVIAAKTDPYEIECILKECMRLELREICAILDADTLTG